MKNLIYITLICLTGMAFQSCDKDDDSNEPEVVTCDEWFEGDPCVAMTTKFVGDYVGGGGFCGTNYEYTVLKTPGVSNGISIGIANPGMEETYFLDAVLTTSTEFDIPLQEIFIQGQSAGSLSGYGNGDGTTLFYHIESEDVGYDCDHEATKVN